MGEAQNRHVGGFHNVVLCKATLTGSAFAALQKRQEAHNLHGRLTTCMLAPGFFPAPKLTDLYRRPSMST
jgi:hypothetical protein